MDGNFYRAVVLAVDGANALVSYVDFGNKEYVGRDRLKPLSRRLKQIPCFAVLVELKAVSREFANDKATAFLDGLVASRKQLTVRLEAGLPVDLVFADKKTTVSAKLNQLLAPDWKAAIAEGRKPAEATLFGNALEDTTLPTRQPLTLTVLHTPRWDRVWACASVCATARYVLSQLHEDIAEYCAAIPDRPYLPRINETCAVRVDERWVRGVCCRSDGVALDVHLVDFGPTIRVGHDNVRKLCRDFVWPRAVAVPCVLQGLPEVKSTELLSRIQQLLPAYSNHLALVTHVTADAFHCVELPDLLHTLETEGWLAVESG